MATYVFQPRRDRSDMRPEFYDHRYTVQYPNHGPAIANPYDQNSSNRNIRQANYIWGRWFESFIYYDLIHYNAIWNIAQGTDSPGYISAYNNGSYNSTYYGDIYYFYDASYSNQSTWTYLNEDSITRFLAPSQVGQIVSFFDSNNNFYAAGVIEQFINQDDYYISNLNTGGAVYPNPEPVRIIHVINNMYGGRVGKVIDNWLWNVQRPIDIRIGHTIGHKPKSLLYSKRILDLRRGLL